MSQNAQETPLKFQLVKTLYRDSYFLKVSYQNQAESNTNKQVYILCLDVSSSMSGLRIEYGREAYADLVEQLVNAGNEVHFIKYDSQIETRSINNMNLNSEVNIIRNTRVRGATNFCLPLEKICEIVRGEKKVHGNIDVKVQFFTDGQATRDTHSLPTVLVNTQATLNTVDNSTVYCRGLGSGNDTQFMEQLLCLGTAKGDYQFSDTAEGIKDIVLNCADMTSTSLVGSLTLPNDGVSITENCTPVTQRLYRLDPNELGEQEESKNDAEEIEGLSTYTADFFLEDPPTVEGAASPKTLTFRFKVGNEEVTETVEVTTADDVTTTTLTLDAVERHFRQICAEATRLFRNRTAHNLAAIATLETETKNMDNFLTSFYENNLRKLPKILRKKLMPRISEIKASLGNFRQTCRDLRVRFDNSKLSQLMATAHKSTKRSLNKMILNREDRNQSAMAIAMKRILQNSQDLTEEQKEELNTCLIRDNINLTGAGDAVEDGTCISASGIVTRTEAAIADGSKVRFKQLHPIECAVSFDLFQEMLDMKCSDLSHRNEDVHNGWDPSWNGSAVMANAYRGKINFVYPLYIHPTHWDTAKELMPQALGFIGALNFAGYTFDYMKTIPFVLVNKAMYLMIDNPTQSNIQNFLNFARVAKQLVTDYKMKTVNTDFTNFIKSAQHRTPSNVKDSGNVCIPSITVFLTKLLFQDPELDGYEKVDTNNDFFHKVLDELIRRLLNKKEELRITKKQIAEWYHARSYVHVPNLLTSSAEAPFLSTYNAEVKARGIRKVDRHISAAGNEVSSVESAEEKSADNSSVVHQTHEFDADAYHARDLPVSANNAVNRILNSMPNAIGGVMKCMVVYNFLHNKLPKIFELLDANLGVVTDEILQMFEGLPASDSVDYIGLYDEKQVFYSALKSSINPSNQAKIDAAKAGKFREYGSDTAHYVLRDVMNGNIRDIIGEENTRIQESMNTAYAYMARQTKDIKVFIGILLQHCKNVGDQAFHLIIRELQKMDDFNTPMLLEKIIIMTSWIYVSPELDEPLVLVRHRGSNWTDLNDMGYRWNPSKKQQYRLMKACRHVRLRENASLRRDNPNAEVVGAKSDMEAHKYRSNPNKIQLILTKAQWRKNVFNGTGSPPEF